MGICYSEQEEWEAYNKQIREKRRNRRKNKNASIIYEQNSVYENSFASKVESSFREDIHSSLQKIVSDEGSIAIGSIVQMNQNQLKQVIQSLSRLNVAGQPHQLTEHITLCNLKTKNFMHTHKISYPKLPKLHEVSCCPYDSNHIVQYDIWKFVKAEADQNNNQLDSDTNQSDIENSQQENYFIYHPFTQRFLNYVKGQVVCSQEKKQWKIISCGPRRNGGFIRIICSEGQLCMTDQRGLLTNHRKLGICKDKHISHLWQLQFGEIQ